MKHRATTSFLRAHAIAGALFAAMLATTPAHAQTAAAPGSGSASAPDMAASSAPRSAPGSAPAPLPAMTDGEVRKVDREQGKLTLRHGPIDSLQMPAMTMVFRVADAKLLDGLKDGDKVRFQADRLGGAITITAIEAAR